MDQDPHPCLYVESDSIPWSRGPRPPLNDSDALMRVIEVESIHCKVHDGAAIHDARPLPALERESPVVVGDWVVATRDSHGALWLSARVPPYTALTRIAPSGERQPLVANVDFALLVMGLDGNFNLRRLERFIALVKSSGGDAGRRADQDGPVRGRRQPHG